MPRPKATQSTVKPERKMRKTKAEILALERERLRLLSLSNPTVATSGPSSQQPQWSDQTQIHVQVYDGTDMVRDKRSVGDETSATMEPPDPLSDVGFYTNHEGTFRWYEPTTQVSEDQPLDDFEVQQYETVTTQPDQASVPPEPENEDADHTIAVRDSPISSPGLSESGEPVTTVMSNGLSEEQVAGYKAERDRMVEMWKWQSVVEEGRAQTLQSLYTSRELAEMRNERMVRGPDPSALVENVDSNPSSPMPVV